MLSLRPTKLCVAGATAAKLVFGRAASLAMKSESQPARKLAAKVSEANHCRWQ